MGRPPVELRHNFLKGGGGRAPSPPPPGSAPGLHNRTSTSKISFLKHSGLVTARVRIDYCCTCMNGYERRYSQLLEDVVRTFPVMKIPLINWRGELRRGILVYRSQQYMLIKHQSDHKHQPYGRQKSARL